MDRDYGEYRDEITIIEAFERYEEETNAGYGETWEDFGPWFMVYRAGWMNCYGGETWY